MPDEKKDQPRTARALQLAERIDFKGLERDDQFSSSPLAFRTGGGAAVLFRFGTAVFIGLNPIEEEAIIAGLSERLLEPTTQREAESIQIILRADADEQATPSGAFVFRDLSPERMLIIAEALAISVALAFDERRIADAFDKVVPIAASLKEGQLLRRSERNLLSQIGEALLIQQRLAGRVELADRPDVLWDHPELERLWVKLTDEFDLGPRTRAIGQKLEVIRETAGTMADLLSTRTSHRLEWYIIALIALELLMGLYTHFVR